jgi:hypothetical protein
MPNGLLDLLLETVGPSKNLVRKEPEMPTHEYSVDELAEQYQISRQQALRYITRFGADREELVSLLSSSSRTANHRNNEVGRTPIEVALG